MATKYCVVCGAELTGKQQFYCSDECRAEAWRNKYKERYHSEKEANSDKFKKRMEKNKERALNVYYARRQKQCYEYAEKVMALSSLDEIAAFLDKNCRFKHGG